MAGKEFAKMSGPEFLDYFESRRGAPSIGNVRAHLMPINELVPEVVAELEQFNEDCDTGDPRYEVHAENMSRLLERVLEARGVEVPQ